MLVRCNFKEVLFEVMKGSEGIRVVKQYPRFVRDVFLGVFGASDIAQPGDFLYVCRSLFHVKLWQ
jgi:hypothetical protein